MILQHALQSSIERMLIREYALPVCLVPGCRRLAAAMLQLEPAQRPLGSEQVIEGFILRHSQQQLPLL